MRGRYPNFSALISPPQGMVFSCNYAWKRETKWGWGQQGLWIHITRWEWGGSRNWKVGEDMGTCFTCLLSCHVERVPHDKPCLLSVLCCTATHSVEEWVRWVAVPEEFGGNRPQMKTPTPRLEKVAVGGARTHSGRQAILSGMNRSVCCMHLSCLHWRSSQSFSHLPGVPAWSSRMKIPMTLPLQLGHMGSQQKSA
jgi:hypothetical protein